MNDITKRTRNYFLTINYGASCFNTFIDTLKDLKVNYAYIHHTETNNDHYHLILMFDNARYFSSVQKLFNGAHIEAVKILSSCFRYLLHLDDETKQTYNFEDIITNFDIVQYFDGGYEIFNPNGIIEDIESGCVTIIHFYKKYGCVIRRYITLIEKLLQCYNIHQLGCYYLNSLSKQDLINYLQDKIDNLEKLK